MEDRHMTVDEKNRMSKMQEKLDKVDDKIDDVLTLLKGDDFGNSEGLVAELKDLKKRTRALEDVKRKVIWAAAGAGIAGGVVIDKIVVFIKTVFFIITFIILFPSCSIFKKNTMEKETRKSYENFDNIHETKTINFDNSIYSDNRLVKRDSFNLLNFMILADLVKINLNGSVEATGNVLLQSKVGSIVKSSDSTSRVKQLEQIDLKSDTDSISIRRKNTLDLKKKTSRPSAKAIFISIISLILGIAILYRFLKK